jgi:hypothetical protein
MFKNDRIDIEINIIEKAYDGGLHKYIETELTVNNTPINSYIDYSEFLFNSRDCRTWYEKIDNLQKSKYSDFYPLTCSCGEAGCVSIWDGIHSKHRKYTTEWRVPKNSGYDGIFDKTFYSFSPKQYNDQIDKIWIFLFDNQHEVIDDDGWLLKNTIKSILNCWKENKQAEYEYGASVYKNYTNGL